MKRPHLVRLTDITESADAVVARAADGGRQIAEAMKFDS